MQLCPAAWRGRQEGVDPGCQGSHQLGRFGEASRAPSWWRRRRSKGSEAEGGGQGSLFEELQARQVFVWGPEGGGREAGTQGLGPAGSCTDSESVIGGWGAWGGTENSPGGLLPLSGSFPLPGPLH